MAGHAELLSGQTRDSSLIAALRSLTRSDGAQHLTIFDLEARNGLLNGYWSEFQRRDYVLQQYTEQLRDQPYFKSDMYSATLSHYLVAKAWFRQRIQEVGAPQPADDVHTNERRGEVRSTQASLEKTRLPTFDGNYKDWEFFKDGFTALVINDTKMDPIVKMQHLYNCLGKEPAEKLKTIKFTGSNFQTAWNSSCARYDNNYLRFSVQMQALINMPTAESEQVAHLCQLINTVDDSINTFSNLGRPKEHWDDIFVYHVESKLAESTRKEWVRHMKALKIKDGFTKYQDIKDFIEDKIHDLDVEEVRSGAASTENEGLASCPKSNEGAEKDKRRNLKNKYKSAGAHVTTQQGSQSTSKAVYSFCKGDHFLGFCHKFSACSQAQRRAYALSAKLCFNCLNSDHTVDACQSKGRCLVCGNRHHTKLHQDARIATNASTTASEEVEEVDSVQDLVAAHVSLPQDIQHVQGMLAPAKRKVLLDTACVVLQGPNGQSMTVRAMVDSCAEESFVSEYVVQALSLKKDPANVAVSGVGASITAVAKTRVALRLKSDKDTNFHFDFSALILKRLSAVIPSAQITTHDWPHLVDLQLADPYFYVPSRVDCILDSEITAAVLLPGIKKGSIGMPVAISTVFGWVVMGSVRPKKKTAGNEVQHVAVRHELSKAVARFWETEEIPDRPMLSPADQ